MPAHNPRSNSLDWTHESAVPWRHSVLPMRMQQRSGLMVSVRSLVIALYPAPPMTYPVRRAPTSNSLTFYHRRCNHWTKVQPRPNLSQSRNVSDTHKIWSDFNLFLFLIISLLYRFHWRLRWGEDIRKRQKSFQRSDICKSHSVAAITSICSPVTALRVTNEGLSQHFHIWRDKQTIQDLWPNCIWRDKQNQEKGLVLESKTGKSKYILHKNSVLDFFQTYTSRHVAYLCIFLYMKSLLCRRKTKCHTSIPSLHSQSLLDYKTDTR